MRKCSRWTAPDQQNLGGIADFGKFLELYYKIIPNSIDSEDEFWKCYCGNLLSPKLIRAIIAINKSNH